MSVDVSFALAVVVNMVLALGITLLHYIHLSYDNFRFAAATLDYIYTVNACNNEVHAVAWVVLGYIGVAIGISLLSCMQTKI